MNQNHTVRAYFTPLISSVSAPTWVRKDTPFNITFNTARPSTCTLNPGNRNTELETSHTFSNLIQNMPVIYTISCTHTPATGPSTTGTETRRINVLPTFREF
jgi:hypothetical protein